MATKRLSLPGKPILTAPEPDAFAGLLNVQVVQQQEVIGVVRGEPLTRSAPIEVDENDVVELQFDGGVVQYLRVDDLEKESPKRRDAKSGGDVIEVPAQFSRGGPSRGAFDWVLKGLKIFHIDPAKELASLGEAELVKRFETNTDPKPGLYRVDREGKLVHPLEPNSLTGTGAFLLFIHGTASSTNGSFGGIFIKRPEKDDAGAATGPTAEWTKLRDVYGDRILALQHRTFSESPVDNALYAVERLPKGARVHLVTHSRGGLVGELLGLKNISDENISVFEQKRLKDSKDPQAAKEAAQQLRRLAELLTQKKLVVEKFVRVAAPARGTILASGRLDLYFTIILNAIGAIPILRNDPIYAILKATALELIKRRADPARLPGLEAMMPSSALVHFLNQRSTLKSDADLAVIAGDLQGDTFWTRLKALATDVFYLEEHDLVVNTEAMFGGMGRSKPAYGFYHRGGIVNHFNYFHNERTRARLHGWLTSKGPDPQFQQFDPEKPGIQIKPVVGRGADTKKPLLIVVPDVFGTRFPDEALWMSSTAEPELVPAYGPLIEQFGATHDVQALPWDWRDSMTAAAAKLAKAIGKAQGNIRLVGHGAGGLVIHLLAQNHQNEWGRVNRALLLGTPHGGMFAAVDWATGHSRLVKMFALADGLRSVQEIAAEIRRWKAIVEVAPSEFLDAAVREANWNRIVENSAPDRQLLDSAWQLRQQLLAKPPQQFVSVAGKAPETLVGYDRHTRALIVTSNGDGRVAHGQLHQGIDTWSADAWHGELPASKSVFVAYAELLKTGKTALLPQLTLPVSGAAEERPDSEKKPLFPQLDDLHAEALAIRTGTAQHEQYVIKVLVTHGDLRMAKYPVAVGHYLGDSINGVEEVLDCQLGGRLTRRFQLGFYPGDAGAVEIVRVEDAKPPGAIVIGLGQVGSATPETVRRGVTLAALRYALMVAEDSQDEKPRSAAFSAVSIATRGGSVLDTAASISAILRGALDANRLLRAQKLWDKVRIDEVELVELYEERAVAALNAAREAAKRMRREAEEGERFDVEPLLHYTASGQFRSPPVDTAMGWWQRLFVTVAEDEEQQIVPADLDEDDDMAAAAQKVPKKKKDRPMRFVVLGDRARVEAELQCRERNATRHLIKTAIDTPSFNPELSGALFEMLVPNAIKAASAAAPNVIMILDHDTAQYPWEVLSDPMVPETGPYAVRTGMLRQFIAPNYRPAPRYAGGKSALVIGDTSIDPNPNNLPELRGAQEEAQGVDRVLVAAGYDTRLYLRAKASEVQTALFAKPYRILHLAGHGIYRPDRPEESGMVLGANVYLTPCQLRQLRTVPDLVFINCCFLGGIPKANALAASIAEELINMGVKAVVAAGWAVDDSAAVTFATTFYEEMLDRRSKFGDAVRSARQAVFRNHSTTNSWAAYQCYGNPGFSLADPEGRADGGGPGDFCSKREYIDDIRTLSAKATELAASTDSTKRETLRGQLADRVAKLPAAWRDGEMLTHIGLAWRDVGDYTNAVETLQAAYDDISATMPISGMEQLTNLLTRLAVQQHGEGKIRERDASMKRVSKWIAILKKLPENHERLAIMGSAAKRLTFVADTPAKRKQRLEEAAEKYSEAAASAQKKLNRPHPYPLLNAIAIRWLLGANPKALLLEAQTCQPIVDAWKDEDEYWKRGARPDYLLTVGLLEGNLDVDSIASAYRSALKKTGKTVEQLSVIEHIEFIAEMLKNDRKAASRRLRDQLAELVKKLRNN